jgi:ubiquinone/menaquinone biosynthesis C-methylase UbiE
MDSYGPQNLFDNMYKGYDNGLSGFTSFILKKFSRPRHEYMFHFLPGGKRMLDIGCGSGEFCILAAKKYDRVIGVDFSEEGIRQAKEKIKSSKTFEKQLSFEIADLNAPPLNYSDASFDTITALVTLDFIYNLNGVLGEIYRLLSPHGYFVFEVNNLAFLPRRLKLLLGKYPNIASVSQREWPHLGWDAGAAHLFTSRDLKYFIDQMGFVVESVSGAGVFAVLRKWRPQMLCGDLIFVCRKKREQ